MDNPELIEKYEREIWCLISRMRADKIRYSVAHFVFKKILEDLELRGYSEDWLEEYTIPD